MSRPKRSLPDMKAWATTQGTSTLLTAGGSTFITSAGSTFWVGGGSTVLTTFSSGDPSEPTSTGTPDDTATSLTSGASSAFTTTTTGPSGTPESSFTDFTSPPISTLSASETSTSLLSSPSPGQNAVSGGAVCIGNGVDASAGGLLATLIIPSLIGLALWLLFAFLRPRFRQIYAVREWFVQQDLRPKPLGGKLWAFLWPHVPLVPDVNPDLSNAGRSAATDADLFPSDEQLAQRTLWIALLIVLGWSFVALVGALPLYLVDTPCLAHSAPRTPGSGVYSALQDLSLIRLLQNYDNQHGTQNTGLFRRGTSSGVSNARVRIIVLTVLVIVLGVLPALWKILREFTRLVEYRRAWLDARCGGQEMGWLSASAAPGFLGWGEKRLKDFVVKTGLSSGMDGKRRNRINGEDDSTGGLNGSDARIRNRTRPRLPTEEEPLTEGAGHASDEGPEIDVQGVFTVGDTSQLAVLIEQRDEILEKLEIAEAKYISSFTVSTPDPSIADYLSTVGEATDEDAEGRPYISRPKPLGGGTTTRQRRPATNQRPSRTRNPAYGSSSLTPTSYMLPQQYYKLRQVEGISGGTFAGAPHAPEMSLSDSFNQRVVGSRFHEISRNSEVLGKLPLGHRLEIDKEGEPSTLSALIPDPSKYGPNHPVESTGPSEPHSSQRYEGEKPVENHPGDDASIPTDEEEWIDLMHEHPEDAMDAGPSGEHGEQIGGVDEMGVIRRRGPLIWDYRTSERRETFPMRRKADSVTGDSTQPPPHLRLQAQGPFVRPLTGLDHEDLGAVYAEISVWRSQLKTINAQVSAAQSDAYVDIAEGARIKGWLIIGRGVRFLAGVKMIEGRAKEDVRWDQLQAESGMLESIILWSVNIMIAILLAAALLAVAGLSLGTAPNSRQAMPFLGSLSDHNTFTTGLATGLAPAVAGSLFMCLALAIVHATGHLSAAVSISGLELQIFKTIFWILTIVCGIWLIVVGAVVFAFSALRTGSSSEGTMGVANGTVYMAYLAISLVFTVAIISPALLLLQPVRLYQVIRASKNSITPRQQFRATYPRSYNPSFSTACCVLAIIFASTFALIFPLIGPAIVLLLLLTLVASRYLVGYVYARTHSQTGGIMQMWVLRRFGTLVAFQPLLLGFILLTRRLWEEGGILVGTGVLVIFAVEGYTTHKTRVPGPQSLSPITQDSLETFGKTARPAKRRNVDEESTDLVSSLGGGGRMRGSMASMLEMMSVTLAVMPGRRRGPVPLPTETLDDISSTERAARTHPDAPPHLPPLPFADHAQEMSGLLYAPELVAPEPIIWLPNDPGGVARQEAYDLQRYHNLAVTLDVTSERDARQLLSRSASRVSRSASRASRR